MNEFSLADLGWVGLMLVIIVGFMIGRQLLFAARAEVGGDDAPRPKRRQRAPPKEAPLPARQAPAPEPAPTKLRVLKLREWFSIVNDEPDDAPHLFIYGASGTGKTTLARAILSDRLGQLVIFDPKNKPGKWGGVPAFELDRDGSYTTIDAGLRSVLDELRQRQQDMQAGVAEFEPLTVVLDELPLLNRNTNHAALVLKELSEIGRELRMRLLMLSWSKRVKELGIAGAGDAIDQFVLITLRRATRRKLGWLAWDEERYPIELSRVGELASRPLPLGRSWTPATPDADRLLTGLLNDELSSVSSPALGVPARASAGGVCGPAARTGTDGTGGTVHQEAVPGGEGDSAATEDVPGGLSDEAIRTLYRAWGSKNRIAAMLTGTKAKRLERIDQALRNEVKKDSV